MKERAINKTKAAFLCLPKFSCLGLLWSELQHIYKVNGEDIFN